MVLTAQSALQHLPHSHTDVLGCHAKRQLHLRSNLVFSVLLKDTSTCSWSDRFEPPTGRLVDDPLHLLIHSCSLCFKSTTKPHKCRSLHVDSLIVLISVRMYIYLLLRLISFLRCWLQFTLITSSSDQKYSENSSWCCIQALSDTCSFRFVFDLFGLVTSCLVL